MHVNKPTSPFGYSMFCDDLRQEVSGKFIYIGVYPGDIIVFGTAPVVLSSLWIIVRYFERPEDGDADVVIKVFAPGIDDPVMSMPIDIKNIRSIPIPPGGSDLPDYDPMYSVVLPIRIAPLEVKQPGHLKIRAYKGDMEIRLGAINILMQAINVLPTQSFPDPPIAPLN